MSDGTPTPRGPQPSVEELTQWERRLSAAGRSRQSWRMWFRTLGWRWAFFAVSGLKRLMDAAVALVLLLLATPLFIGLGLVSLLTGRRLFTVELTMGRWCVPFKRLRFEQSGLLGTMLRWLRLVDVPVLLNVLKGDMSLVGPRATPFHREAARDKFFRTRHLARPGLVSLWWLRHQTNIDFEPEYEIDLEYVVNRGFVSDAGILMRVLPAAFLGNRVSDVQLAPQVRILGVDIDNVSMSEAVADLVDLMDEQRAHLVSFVNVACLNIAAEEPAYLQALQASDRVLADGIGVKLAGTWLGTPIRQNVNGTDLFPRLLAAMGHAAAERKRRYRVYLLGGKPGIPDRVREYIEHNFPSVEVVGHRDGYFKDDDIPAMCAAIRDAETDLLLVAMGVPRQELFLAQHLQSCQARVAVGVGGLFDFYSGNIPRAPQWLRDIGMEWSWRLAQEPRRMWRRYLLGNAVFLFRVFQSRLRQGRGQSVHVHPPHTM